MIKNNTTFMISKLIDRKTLHVHPVRNDHNENHYPFHVQKEKMPMTSTTTGEQYTRKAKMKTEHPK
ncbi:Helicase protein MOM1 [Zea mays]|uniref:Helicase protein MOM1 n=1 Tax=Zea mays TaxID=4577 RepID=A0A1D6NY14_MAIZE|nr:Helicase protein MOM1 [Zea mays]